MAYFNNGQPFYGQPNMYQNNGFMQGQGVQFNPGFQPTRLHNVLTADEIAELMKTNNQFSLALTEKDKKRAVCNHQKADGTGDALNEDLNDGKVVCSICGYKFKPLDAFQTTPESLKAAVEDILDVLQTIKLIWFDIDGTVAREYFQIIPLIEKIPNLFDIAAKNYAKHESVMPWGNNNKNMSTMQAFAMLSNMLNGGAAPNPAMYQQQMQYQQPMPGAWNPAFGAQPNPAMYQQPAGNMNPTNGFGFVGAGPMSGYQAQTQGYQTVYGQPVDPNAQAPQGVPQPSPAPVNQQPGAPEAASATTDGVTKTVAASFKA